MQFLIIDCDINQLNLSMEHHLILIHYNSLHVPNAILWHLQLLTLQDVNTSPKQMDAFWIQLRRCGRNFRKVLENTFSPLFLHNYKQFHRLPKKNKQNQCCTIINLLILQGTIVYISQKPTRWASPEWRYMSKGAFTLI